jgi:hypothetical protein
MKLINPTARLEKAITIKVIEELDEMLPTEGYEESSSSSNSNSNKTISEVVEESESEEEIIKKVTPKMFCKYE